MLAQYPDLASVPVEPPLSTDTSSWKFDPVFLSGNLTGARAATMQGARHVLYVAAARGLPLASSSCQVASPLQATGATAMCITVAAGDL